MDKESSKYNKRSSQENDPLSRSSHDDPFSNESLFGSSDSDQHLPNITDEEVEQALINVHKRLGFPATTSRQKEQGSLSTRSRTIRITSREGFMNRVFAIAAVFLIGIGLGWILIPITHTVPAGERMTLELSDGSYIELNSGTELRRSRLYGRTQRTLQLNGEGFFQVKPGTHPFIVKANGSVTEVLGTEFNLRSWQSDPDAETRLSVLSGTVRFYPEARPEAAVDLGEGLVSNWNHRMTSPQQPDSINGNRIAGWRQNHLSFTDQPLSVIFSELERRFRITIEVAQSTIGDRLLTTFYTSPNQVESILMDICTVKGLRFERTSTGYRITERPHEAETH